MIRAIVRTSIMEECNAIWMVTTRRLDCNTSNENLKRFCWRNSWWFESAATKEATCCKRPGVVVLVVEDEAAVLPVDMRWRAALAALAKASIRTLLGWFLCCSRWLIPERLVGRTWMLDRKVRVVAVVFASVSGLCAFRQCLAWRRASLESLWRNIPHGQWKQVSRWRFTLVVQPSCRIENQSMHHPE